MTTTQTGNPTARAGLAALAFTRRLTSGLLEGIPEDELATPPCPKGNHALWIAGHIALTDDMFCAKLGGFDPLCPPEWQELFGMGSEAVPDASRYPAMSEIVAMMETTRARTVGWFAGMSDDDLAKELPEDWQPFAKNHAELMSTMSVHEGMHAGQLSTVRRAIGLPPRF